MSCSKLLFVKMSPHAFTPTKGSKLAAGYDLMAAYDGLVPKRGSALIKTDIQIQLPSGTYGRVAPRSGLALKNKIDVGAGVIDEDYRGNVGVILFNHSDEDFPVGRGDRVAQLICSKIEYPMIEEVKELDSTVRGEGGFGSTGIAAAAAPELADKVVTSGYSEPKNEAEAIAPEEPVEEAAINENECKKPRLEPIVNAVTTVTTTTTTVKDASVPAESETAPAISTPISEEVEMKG